MALPTLETDRFILRQLEEADLPLLVEMDTDAEVMRYLGGARTEEQVRGWLPRILHTDPRERYGFWCILDRDSGEKHGWVLLKPMPIEDPAKDQFFDEVPSSGIEVGYRLKRSSWGKGIATEASLAFLPYAFETLGLETLKGCTDFGNDASQNVLLKLGMRPLGNQRSYGEEIPTFEITAEEWRADSNKKDKP